ncbi:DUF7344 domain-containing protein [Halorussus caseinilyticus]|uniref:DUF7344 domain-containing protein n=1 Tax=Halorussus caseinilyticus TaxID=3034025 RepID=A0ABD5WI82_9EURY|nr:hypothetical protein [Halorussus sp. DT72]
MSKDSTETKSETTPETGTTDADPGDTTPDAVPTADLRTGAEPSERLDAAFELLADPLRREILYHLADADETSVELSSLAEAVVREGTPEGESGASGARSLAVELHHAHLPKLESHGVVAYDPERRTVRYRRRPWLDEWVEHVRRAESERR